MSARNHSLHTAGHKTTPACRGRRVRLHSIGLAVTRRGALSRPRLRRLEIHHYLLPPHAAIPALDLDTARELSLPRLVGVHKLPACHLNHIRLPSYNPLPP